VVAKLYRPRVPPLFVRRQRLIDMLDKGSTGPATLVHAGPGWGKTLLAASWAETATRAPVGWLSLDAEDNNPAVFWSHVLATLRETGVTSRVDDLQELSSRSSVNRGLIERIVHGLAQLSGDVILVLDDLDAIREWQVNRDLAFLLRRQPEQLHLVLVGRTDSAPLLHRLRAAGELAEIRAADLAFTVDEAAEMLAHHDLRLSENELQRLLERTEGWAAGLRSAAIFLTRPGNRRRIDDFAGYKGAVADYLLNEVLAHQAPEIRRFLLYTSIVEPLSGDLADALTGQTHGQRTLEQLERANTFVIGLGSRPGSFRYHHLFGELLSHQLLLELPEMIPNLHLRAVGWYLAHGETLKALKHAAAAQNWPLVGQLVVTRAGPLVVTAESAALIKILTRVPPEWFSATAELKFCGALLRYEAHDYDAIPSLAADARNLLRGREEADRRPIEVALGTLELTVARQRGDMPALVAAATEVLDRLAGMDLDRLPSQPKYRAIALNNKGVGLLWTGQMDLADRYLWAAMTAARSTGVDLTEINAIGHLALIEAMQGRLGDAEEYARSGRDVAERRGWGTALQAVPAHLALAWIDLERNDIAQAQQSLKRGFDGYRADLEAAQGAVLRILQSRLLLARGEVDAALAALHQARLDLATTVGPVVSRWLALAEAEVDLAAGHPENVDERIGHPAVGTAPGLRELSCLARAAVAQGDLRRAEALLAPLLATSSDPVASVEAWIVTALIADSQRQGNRSVEALTRALAIAEPDRLRRPFVSIGGGRMAALIERQRWLVSDNATFVADILAQLAPGPQSDPPLPDALSERELEVLRYLPTMLSAGQIARDLHVSVNTIKAHLRAIYRKLGVSHRHDAVVRARGLGLI
jgi:LuxR family maltose regulon positive regulatory protein